MALTRTRVRVEGIVQGVGFRPFVHALAGRLGLAGLVGNDAGGVFVEVEGAAETVERFLEALAAEAPPLAVIERVTATPLAPTGSSGFAIAPSQAGGERQALVSPDTATCADCLAELADPADRRYRYPFINCTNCGPRFTIVRDVPYDRPATTMAAFAMCADCAREYHDPADRRFHAQPVCCPACGPSLALLDRDGTAAGGDPLAGAAARLRDGAVVAVKGLGGYHLAADAASEPARGRAAGPQAPRGQAVRGDGGRPGRGQGAVPRSTRPRRPAGQPRAARSCCCAGAPEGAGSAVAPSVAPGNRSLGVMLPYTPLHHLLLAEVGEADRADQRERLRRADRLPGRRGGRAPRRDRRRVPDPRPPDPHPRRRLGGAGVPGAGAAAAPLPRVTPPSRSGCPGRSPATCWPAGPSSSTPSAWPRAATPSSPTTSATWRTTRPSAPSPRGSSTSGACSTSSPRWSPTTCTPSTCRPSTPLELDGVELVGVQHHHAHIASCLADNGEPGPVIGVAFDGLGYGTDGTIWGGELLVADLAGFRRAGHLEAVPMPGGAAAIREPWRMAAAWLDAAFGGQVPERLAVAGRNLDRWEQVAALARSGTASPATSSAGRLFDAVSAILGVRDAVNYEGQAAMELEQLADPAETAAYPARVAGAASDGAPLLVGGRDLVRAVVEDLEPGVRRAADRRPLPQRPGRRDRRRLPGRPRRQRPGDGGPVRRRVPEPPAARAGPSPAWSGAGFRVLVHSRVPPNDGGISLGQAAVAGARRPEQPEPA